MTGSDDKAPVYVCLVRAIGPMTHPKMSMAALREGCEAAGFADVATVGNTGNVLLRSARSAAAVRQAVQAVVDGFGIGERCEVFVRTPRQMQRVVDANPFPEAARDSPATLAVCVFHTTPAWPEWIANWAGKPPLMTVGAHLVVDYSSGAAFDIEKRLGVRGTMRNWRVFAGLAAKGAAR